MATVFIKLIPAPTASSCQAVIDVTESGWKQLSLNCLENRENTALPVSVDQMSYGTLRLPPASCAASVPMFPLRLDKGRHTVSIGKPSKGCVISGISVEDCAAPQTPSPSFTCCNPDISQECRALMDYFRSIYGTGILTGQQTSYLPAKEIAILYEVTGKYPALRGFDLMSYSLATDTLEQTAHCREELSANPGSVEEAIRWAKDFGGLVTFCWHWFSPIRARNKSFYTQDTPFCIELAVRPDTPEYEATLRDIDAIALQLKRLEAQRIPVLWRPLHEAAGGWFWWGAGTAQAYKKLYILLYERLTHYHHINNLIWVWNSPETDWYPGDEYVDILSTDIYSPAHDYGPLTADYLYTRSFSPDKPTALGENGPVPDPGLLQSSRTPWLWFLTWGGGFVDSEEHNTKAQLQKMYHSSYAITLDKLPRLY